jgi:hypothetical protein
VILAGLDIVVMKETVLEDVRTENARMEYATAVTDIQEIIVI